jgi:nitroreductase
MLRDLIRACRSYRRFDASHPVSLQALENLVDLARWSPSGMNSQPLKYILSADQTHNDLIFPQLMWAMRLKDWGGPAPEERPAGYVIILGDREVATSFGVDHGIAAHAILLGATEMGLGGCMFGSIRRNELRAALAIPERYEILLAVAIGRPTERVVLEDVPGNADVGYYREPDRTHHVPKRRRDDVIVAKWG